MKTTLLTLLALCLSACVGYGTSINPADMAKATAGGQAAAFCGTYTGVGGGGTVTFAVAAPGTTMQVSKDCATVSTQSNPPAVAQPATTPVVPVAGAPAK